MTLEYWEDEWDVLDETGTHSFGESEDMVEGSDLVAKGAGVERDSGLILHTFELELERAGVLS